MKKIGFIDHFLSEWHANHYPDMIRKNALARELGMEVCYAYADLEVSPYDGVSTDDWCRKFGAERVGSPRELAEKSDCIVLLSPDNPELHWTLAQDALRSGKPVYIDKTFATGKAEAERLFSLAEEFKTPLYSSSALRFAAELEDFRKSGVGAKSCVVTGPHLFEIYAIHIFEIMCTVMKGGARRMMAVMTGKNRGIVVDYGGGRSALFNQNETGEVPFSASVETMEGEGRFCPIGEGYFDRFIQAMVEFFADGRPKADPRETVDLMGMLERARDALAHPYRWMEL